MRLSGPGVAILAVVAVGLVAWPVSQLTDTGLERSIKEKLGIVADNPSCHDASDSPGWAAGPALPTRIDEPRAVTLDGRIYLAGGILEILDFGKPSDVPGVPERVEVRSSRELIEFDPATGRYVQLPPLPRPLNHIGFVEHQGDLFVVGGHGNLLFGAEPQAGLFRYDVGERRWESLPPMPTARGAVAVGVVGDRLYVAGGMRSGRPVRTVEAYDFRRRSWSTVADLPVSREHIAGAVAGGRLYVIGGRDATDDSLDRVDRYDPRRDRWEEVAPLPQPSGGLEAVTVDGAILAMGGGDDRERWVTGKVQRLDLDTLTWSQLPRMRTPRHGFASALVDGRIWTFGGSPCALFAASDTVETFDPPAS